VIRGMPGDVLPIYKCHAEPLGFAKCRGCVGQGSPLSGGTCSYLLVSF
jgi:hypothetical protein